VSVANEMWPLAEEIRGLRAVANVYSVQDLTIYPESPVKASSAARPTMRSNQGSDSHHLEKDSESAYLGRALQPIH
jgi:hypothetical protein